MPSDTPGNYSRRQFGLSTLIVAVFLGAMTLVAALTMVGGYNIARKAIEADVERYRKSTHSVASLVMQSRLNHIKEVLQLTILEERLQRAMAAGDEAAIVEQLSSVYFSQEEGRMGIMFARLANSDNYIDIGTQNFEIDEFHDSLDQMSSLPQDNTVITIGPADKLQFVVVARRKVISPGSGRVLGTLFGGIVLNDNLSLMHELQTQTDSETAAIHFGERVIAAYPPGVQDRLPSLPLGNEQLENLSFFETRLPLQMPGQDNFYLLTGQSLTAIESLRANYLSALFVLLVGLVTLSVMAAWALKHITQKATHSLSDFASRVGKGEKNATFEPTSIREFNDVGNTLQHFVDAFRESEIRAQTILNNAAAMIAIKSKDGRFTFVNHEFERLFGQSADEIVGKTSQELFPGDDAEVYNEKDRYVLENNKAVQFETVLPSAGSKGTFVVTKFPLADRDGRVQSVCSIATNITDRKNAELALTDALSRAEQANRAKSEFLATMSHEFRTPLNAILGFSDMLRAEVLGAISDKYRDYAAYIHSSGEHMLSLVDDILDISAIEAGRRSYFEEPVDVDELIGDAMTNFTKIAEEKNIRLEADVQPGLAQLNADKRSMIKIVQNLISNAVKFTDDGGIVTVKAWSDRNAMYLSVTDTGIGIDDKALGQITQPFYQVHQNAHVARLGTGLGLSIVKSMVEANRGKLSFKSELGKGTVVTVTIPIDQAMSA